MSSPLGIPGVQQPDEIGRGGFGTVYRAEEPEFNRAVAVKIIQDRVAEDEVRRAFARECQAMGRLSGHPHIVTVHRGGTTELGEPFIVMDLMEAGSLADRLDREGPLPWSDVLDIGVTLAGALETAHRAGILHLDVKPANVLVSRYGEVKLADFGISRLPGVTATTDGRVRASIAYAAPERLLDGTATPAADLYALGSTLYTLLAGEPAFTTRGGEDLLVAISRIVQQPVPDLRRHGVPDPMVRVVERLLAKSPIDRFPTAADAAQALQAAQRATGRPVTRAVVDGVPAVRAAGQTWPMRGQPAGEPDGDEERPPTRPRYVPPDRQQPSAARPSTPELAAAATNSIVPAARPDPSSPPPAAATGTPQPRRPHSPPPITNRPTAGPTLIDVPAPAAQPTAAPAGMSARRARFGGRPLAAATAVVAVLAAAVGGGLLLRQSAEAPQPVTTTSTAAVSPTTAAPQRRITLAAGVTHPDREAIADRLDGYFVALNERDYARAFGYFSPDSSIARNGLAAFREGNSTTQVDRQRIVAINDMTVDRVQASVTYRSTQDAEFGPSGETCTNWNLAYELVGARLEIRRARALSKPQPC